MSKSMSLRDRIRSYHDGSSAYSGAGAREILCKLQIDPSTIANLCVRAGEIIQLFSKNEQGHPQMAAPELHNG